MITPEVLEQLAALEHEQWLQWATQILQTEPDISAARAARWKSVMVPYDELSEDYKEHDRVWARKVIDVINRPIRSDNTNQRNTNDLHRTDEGHTMKITRKLLEERGAYCKQLKILYSEWPNGAEITEANCLRAAELGLDIGWAARKLLPEPLRTEYKRQKALIWAEYNRQWGLIWAEYDRQRELIWAEYDRQREPIWKEYKRQHTQMWEEYERQEAPIWAEYERNLDLIWDEYERQHAPIRAKYDRQRALLFCELAKDIP
jgi:hypothetical protein